MIEAQERSPARTKQPTDTLQMINPKIDTTSPERVARSLFAAARPLDPSLGVQCQTKAKAPPAGRDVRE